MEAVPRMCMLSLELKWSLEKVEFGPSLKQYIQNHYMEEPGKYNEEIKQLDQLRVNATNVTRDFNGISTLKKYYGQLHLLTSRFPITDGGEAAPVFTWIDTFHEEPFSHADAAFDQSCILYNLGVLHSILGAKESRASEEEMKVACTHFQCAAGAFSYLKDHFQSCMSPDISFDLMTIYINLMLGQAQECLLEKSMQDNRKSSLVARISMQVIDYYRQALRGLEDSNISSLMGSRRSKTWRKTIQVKIAHFLSVAYMYMSNQSHEKQKHGERVSWLQQALDRHNEAIKLSKGADNAILQALNFTKDVVLGKFDAAKKDNDFVYHDAMPAFENLPEIKGASLVKSLTFQPYDESIAGPDIFKKLVPIEAHEAASMYSEEKAKLLRRVGDEIEQKSKHLEQFMASLQLDQLKLDAADEPERLPQVMLEVCAALSVKNDPIRQLVNCMQELSGIALDVDADVKDLQEILDEEDKQEAEFQKECGKRPTKILDDIKQEFSKYKEGNSKASRSNQDLHNAMEKHIQNIRKLASPLDELQASLPSIKDAQSSADKEVESKLKMLSKKVEEMKNQRTSLETQLRDQLRNDDITNRIVITEGGNLKGLFEEEMKKHDTIVAYIEQNLSAQENILKALTEANAAYADTRKNYADITRKRDDKIQELIGSYKVYDDLVAKSHKGIEFYKKLQQELSKLLTRTKGVVKVNQEEREATMARLKPKPVQARPSAPKPVLPANPVPSGPKLSDFWKPKSSALTPPVGGGSIGSVPTMPAAVSGQHPLPLGHGPYPSQGLARQSSFDSPSSLSSLDSYRLPSQTPSLSQSGSGSGSPIHVGQPSSTASDPSRMLQGTPTVPQNQPSGPVSLQSHPPAGGLPLSQAQQPQPSVPHPGNLPHSQIPMISSSGSQQPAMPVSRPQMQQPMKPQPFSQSQPQPPPQLASGSLRTQQIQAPHSQQQPGYSFTSSAPPSSYPQQSVLHMPPGAHQQQTDQQPHSVQAQPHTSTAMVSSITTPIPAAVTHVPMQNPNNVNAHQSLNGHQQIPQGGSSRPPHLSSQMQSQPSVMPQSNIPPQPQQINTPLPMNQPHSGYQSVMQQPQKPIASQPDSKSQFTMMPNQIRQAQPPQSTSQPLSHQQGMSQLPGVQGAHPTGPQQQQHHHYQQPAQQFTQTPKASPQHRPQQNTQPRHPTPSGPQHMGSQQFNMPPSQTSTASPQHRMPLQQGPAQPSPNQQAGFGQGMPPPQQQYQQQENQQQLQQQPLNQPQFSATHPQQGSPVRHGPQGIPQSVRYPSQAQGQQAYPQQQPGSAQNLPPANQAAALSGGGMPGMRPAGTAGQPPHGIGHQQANIGQPLSHAGRHQMVPTGQQPGSGRQPTSVSQVVPTGPQPGTTGHPPKVGQAAQAPYPQAGGQVLRGPQLQHQQPVPTQQQQQPVQQHSGPAQSNHQPYSQQPQSQQSGQYTGVQQGTGYANQSQHLPQGFSQPSPVQLSPSVNPPNQRMPLPGGSSNQPYQQPVQPPLNQVQQVNKALKEEQRRLPQPSLQPVKIDPSSRDLLSNSPDSEQISLGKPLVPQTDTSEASPEDATSTTSVEALTFPTTTPPTQPYSSNEAALSDIFKQTGLPSTSTQPAKLAESQSPGKPITIVPSTVPSSAGQSVIARPFPKSKDPYDDKHTLDKFVDEVERFEKYVDGLGKQMLSGPIVLDGLWKELSEAQDRDTRHCSIAVARCYSIKNRHPDVMPYDHNRVKLQTGKDDYINASFINDLSPASPRFIATQAPVTSAFSDFWLMVYEQQVSLIAMLVSQAPTAKSKADFDQYWPEERGQVKTYGSILISLQSKRSTDHQIDRTFHLIHKDTKQERTVFQLQFTAWPEFGVPNRPADLLQYISEVNSYYMQQRSLSTPIVVHCNSGVGRTGTFCLIYSAVREMMCGGGIIDIPRKVKTLRQQRRGMVAEKEQLKFTYTAVLCFAQQILSKRGLSVKSSVSSPQVDLKNLQRITSFDVIMGADSVTSLHSRISKMSVRTSTSDPMPAPDTTGPVLQDSLTDQSSLLPVSDNEPTNQGPVLPPEIEPETPAEVVPCDEAADEAGQADSPAKSRSPSNPSSAVQATPSLVEFTESNLTDFSLNPPQFIPDVVESSQQEGGAPAQGSKSPGDGSLPSILADLTPQNFSIKGNSKQRISKADFTGQKSMLGANQSEDDPLGSLDPLWTMKSKEK
ncbi:tyrosine-protein phosphatase non-receptor type 23-like isoform X2 [Acanthaster planci]|uniref:Tyrosine-protein phosphatase non-receptor type 23-like isoform X2 n=1 Tax=Acanthaster planci TaxID=133434 RepID=A0A8B7ZEJ4_ACAPL|nr:tyrosine-protein phosphatase non-receptor type 23-like isoform X2 [Acanthaster planci]